MIVNVATRWTGGQAVARAASAMSTGAMNAANGLLKRARPLAPIDTGQLRASGRAERTGIGKAIVAFNRPGPNNAPIAIIQHEVTWYNHPRGGQAKYLEAPMKSYAPQALTDMAGPIRAAFS